jgi:hypothetical protein
VSAREKERERERERVNDKRKEKCIYVIDMNKESFAYV